MTTVELIDRMLDGWTEDQWCKGQTVDPCGLRRCALGRAACCGSLTRERFSLSRAFYDTNNVSLVFFNDHPETTFADVVDALRKTRAYLMENEAWMAPPMGNY